jgi:predicted metalloprotease with PDZ domain
MTGAWTLLMAVSLGAPVPKAAEPDPLAWGYLGVRVNQGSMTLSSVEPTGPAIKAGLQAEDQIVSVGTLEKPKSFDEVAEHISNFRPGSMMRVQVRRNGELKSFNVKLGVRPLDLGPPPNKKRIPIPEEP